MDAREAFGKGLRCYKDRKYEDAVYYLKQAVDGGDIQAMNYLANCYLSGLGTAANTDEAIKLYRKAGSSGNSSALLNLGYCYENGIGVKANCEYASDYYERAANLGNTIAMISLALLYRDGKGLDKDVNEAIKLLKKALSLGNNDAKQYLEKLDSKSTTSQTSTRSTTSTSTSSSTTNTSRSRNKATQKKFAKFGLTTETIMFGKYPQTIVSDKKVISRLKNLTPNSDGYLVLDGEEYVKAKTPRWGYRAVKFTDGTELKYGEIEHFFKVEPIVWNVLKKNNNEMVVITQQIIIPYSLDTAYYYKSNAKKFLEEDFYAKTLNKNKAIVNVKLDSGVDFGSDPDTDNHVYMLSKAEVQELFGSSDDKDPARIAVVSDYARCQGCFTDFDYNEGAGIWLLRSYEYGWQPHGISRTGGIYIYGTHNTYGLRPVMTIKNNYEDTTSKPNSTTNQAMDNLYQQLVEKTTQQPVKQQPKPVVKVNQNIEYVYFGKYPKTIVSDASIISKLEKTIPDQFGYYELNGELYAEALDKPHRYYSINYKYSDGTKPAGKKKFFKVEPIKWRIIGEKNGVYELMTEEIIDISVDNTRHYDSSIHSFATPNKAYDDWATRKWLNNEFIDLAFKGISSNLLLTEINGNLPSKYNYLKFNDYVYLLSEADVSSESYGFPQTKQKDISRVARVTDYSMARGCYADPNLDYAGIWMLRQINYRMTSLGAVATDGLLHCISKTGGIYNYNYGLNRYGLRPVIRINKTAIDNPIIDEVVEEVVELKPKKQPEPVVETYEEEVIPVVEEVKPVKEPEVVIKPKTQNIVKKDGHVLLGKYPQSVETDSNIINVLNTSIPNSAGYYEYNGVEYEKVTAKPYRDKYKFNDGTQIKVGQNYYFKLEPIKWRVLSDNNGEMLLMTSTLLDSVKFYQAMDDREVDGDEIDPNNYQYSEIREWLNGYFYNKALANEAAVISTTIDNSSNTCSNDYTGKGCNNTFDKVFLLSYKDVVNPDYGFDESDNLSNSRELKITDYNRAKGAHMMTNLDYNTNGSWWLRSPSEMGEDYVNYVDYDGIVNYCTTSNKIRSVCIAIKIKK